MNENNERMSRDEYYQYVVTHGEYNKANDADYRRYVDQYNANQVRNDKEANDLASESSAAGRKQDIIKSLDSLKGEYFDTNAMSGTYEQLVAQVEAFCDINKSSKQLVEENMTGGTDAALVGLPGATATKSWGDNMGAMDDLEQALRAYADAEQAIIKDNIKTDNEMRDTFAAVSRK